MVELDETSTRIILAHFPSMHRAKQGGIGFIAPESGRPQKRQPPTPRPARCARRSTLGMPMKWSVAKRKWRARRGMGEGLFLTKLRRMHIDIQNILAVTDVGVCSPPKWKQGHAEYYTRDGIAQRLSLRSDTGVADALHHWWLVVQQSFGSVDEPLELLSKMK